MRTTTICLRRMKFAGYFLNMHIEDDIDRSHFREVSETALSRFEDVKNMVSSD